MRRTIRPGDESKRSGWRRWAALCRVFGVWATILLSLPGVPALATWSAGGDNGDDDGCDGCCTKKKCPPCRPSPSSNGNPPPMPQSPNDGEGAGGSGGARGGTGSDGDGAGTTEVGTFPIALYRGAVRESVVDIDLPGPALGWRYVREYDSRLVYSSGNGNWNGFRWRGSEEGPFLLLSGSDVTVGENVSRRIKFTWNGSAYNPPTGYEYTTLVKSGSGAAEKYTYTNYLTGRVLIFWVSTPSLR